MYLPNKPDLNKTTMKEDWIIVFSSSKKEKANQIKRMLNRSGIEVFLRITSGPIQQTKLYAPSNKLDSVQKVLNT